MNHDVTLKFSKAFANREQSSVGNAQAKLRGDNRLRHWVTTHDPNGIFSTRDPTLGEHVEGAEAIRPQREPNH